MVYKDTRTAEAADFAGAAAAAACAAAAAARLCKSDARSPPLSGDLDGGGATCTVARACDSGGVVVLLLRAAAEGRVAAAASSAATALARKQHARHIRLSSPRSLAACSDRGRVVAASLPRHHPRWQEVPGAGEQRKVR
jgi:hypothetical protein